MTLLKLKATIPLCVLFGLVQPVLTTAQSAVASDEVAPVELGESADGDAANSQMSACEQERAAEGCAEILVRAFVCEQAPEMNGCETVAELAEPQPDVTPPVADAEIYVEPRAEGAIESALEEDIPARSELEMYEEPEDD